MYLWTCLQMCLGVCLSTCFFVCLYVLNGLAAWRSSNAFHSINEVTLRWARLLRLVLGWVTVCVQVNHFGM